MILILLVFALVLFVLGAYIAQKKGNLEITLIGIGLACWVATAIFGNRLP